MLMQVVRFDDVEAFYARVEPYLAAHEAEHNLTLGIISTIRHNPLRYAEPFFALVEADRAIQLVALMTPPRPPVLSLATSPAAVDALAEYFFDAQIVLPGVNGPAEESDRFAATWSTLTGRRAEVRTPMRTFKLERVNPVSGVAGRMRPATLADRDLLIDWELAFVADAFPDAAALPREDAERMVDFRFSSPTNYVFLWQDAAGVPVSLTAGGSPTPNGMRIGPVYTPTAQRGHGYASALVAGVSQWLLDRGSQFCFLFTDLRNPTSNHIYQVIGYQPVGDFTEYSFSDI